MNEREKQTEPIKDNQKRLEELLLNFVERVTTRGTTSSKEMEILPEVVTILIELWSNPLFRAK